MEMQMACRAAPNVKEGRERPSITHARHTQISHTQTVVGVLQWTRNLFH